ncbi:MAG: alpha-amylase family glycosyl hydrolase [Prochlorococcaceae cyanobacterium]|jgi:cyclomaltodextrin glucanotransferase
MDSCATRLDQDAIRRSPAGFLITPEMDFRRETIYFIVIDRFHNSCAANDRVGRAGLFDSSRTQWGHYWGGDLQGVIDKADYLEALGITAIWLSPLFEQVDDMQLDRAPMHGYWTRDFKRINPHFVAAEDSTSLQQCNVLRQLVEVFHARGIKLILDIVCNHSSPDINGSKGVLFDDGVPIADFNNDTNNFYYHFPEITDWNDEFQLIHYEMLGLATFNEKNIEFRRYIKSAIRAWLDVGFDALRVDTVKHMPIWFWQEFVADIRRAHPATFIFGEYGFGSPHDARTLAYANGTGMSILDFGLAYAIRDAFTPGKPGGFRHVQALLELDPVYRRATELVTFLDNHDMPRFLSIAASDRAVELATILLMTLRGIPCLFYGTEQYLVNNTGGGQDPYNRPMMERWDRSGTLFGLIQILARLRRENRALAYGSHQQCYVSDSLYAYSRRHRDSRVFVALNQGEAATLARPETGLPEGVHRCRLSGREVVVQSGRLENLQLPAGGALVLSVGGAPVEGVAVVKFQLNGYFTVPGQHIAVTGDVPELGGWDLRRSVPLEYVNGDTWFNEIAFDASAGSPICFKFVVLRPDDPDPAWSAQYENVLYRRFLLPPAGRVKLEANWEAF